MLCLSDMARTEFCLEDGVCLVLLKHWGHSWKRDQKSKSKYCCVYSIIPWANPETAHYWAGGDREQIRLRPFKESILKSNHSTNNTWEQEVINTLHL